MVILIYFAFIELLVFLSIAPFTNKGHGVSICIVMIIPSLWLSRLIKAKKQGVITKRFLYLNTPMLPSSISITNPDVLDKKSNKDEFWSYFIKESAICIFVWVFLYVPFLLNAMGLLKNEGEMLFLPEFKK